MHSWSLSFVITAILGLCVGCSKDSAPTPVETVPDPVAGFTFSGRLVSPTTIYFKNASRNADTYKWDFGDGQYSADSCPANAYIVAATYKVALIASCRSTGRCDSTSQQLTITPGRAFIESVSIVDIPFTNSNGDPWDVGSGPDLYPIFSDWAGRLVNFRAGYVNDVGSGDLPLAWGFTPNYEITDWTKEYFVECWDHDPLGDDDYIGISNGFSINGIIKSEGYTRVAPVQDLTGKIKFAILLVWQ